MSKREYVATLKTLFDRYIVAAISNRLGLLPEETISDGFDHIRRSVSPELVEGQMDIAIAMGDLIGKNYNSWLTKAAGACITRTPLLSTCVPAFIRNLGGRAYRRPLKATEEALYQAIYDENDTTPAQGVRAVVIALLISPGFLYMMEDQGVPVTGRTDLLKLTSYELASRLSYAITGSMPDPELFAAAASGVLDTPDGLKAQFDRLLAGPLAKTHLDQFYRQWLKVDRQLPINYTGAFRGNISAAFYPQSLNELDEFIDYITWTKNGKYQDLLLSRESFTQSWLSRVYGSAEWVPDTAPILLPAGERAGLLTRVAMLANGEDIRHPFRRGTRVMNQFLCRVPPRPDPDMLPDGALDEPPIDAKISSRERFETKTNAPLCMTCHKQINPLSFAFETYDTMGRYSTSEKIYHDGTLIGTVGVNTAVDLYLGGSTTKPINGPLELSNELATADVALECFGRQWFRYAYARMETSGDACSVTSMKKAATSDGGSILQMLRQTTLDPAFRLRKVGAP